MNIIEIVLEIEKLNDLRKKVIKEERLGMIKKIKGDIKKYGITRTELNTAFKKRKVKVNKTV